MSGKSTSTIKKKNFARVYSYLSDNEIRRWIISASQFSPKEDLQHVKQYGGSGVTEYILIGKAISKFEEIAKRITEYLKKFLNIYARVMELDFIVSYDSEIFLIDIPETALERKNNISSLIHRNLSRSRCTCCHLIYNKESICNKVKGSFVEKGIQSLIKRNVISNTIYRVY